MATLDDLLRVHSRLAENLIAFLEGVAGALDRAEWNFGGRAVRPSELFVEPEVFTEEKREPERDGARGEAERESGRLSPQEEVLWRLYEHDRAPGTHETHRWGEVMRRGGLRLVCVGEPGGGKTYCTRHAAVLRAQEGIRRLQGCEALPDEVPISVWITAQHLASQPERLPLGVALVRALESQPGIAIPELLRPWLEERVAGSGTLVVVDALDELENDPKAIERFKLRMGQLDRRPASVVVTCRTAVWPERENCVPWTPVERVELAPFDGRRQQEYVGQFAAAIAGSAGAAERMRARLAHEPALRHHCRTPFILAHAPALEATGELPADATEAQFYEALVGALLRGAWKPLEAVPTWARNRVDRCACRAFLAPLAWALFRDVKEPNRFTWSEWKRAHDEGKRRCEGGFIGPSKLLKDLAALGLVVAGRGDRWSFAHRTVLEFLGAAGLREDEGAMKWLLETPRTVEESPFWFKPQWIQPLRFLAGLMGDPTPLVRVAETPPLVGGKPGPADDLFRQGLGWRCRLVGAGRGVARETLEQVAREALEFWERTWAGAPLDAVKDHALGMLGELGRNPEAGALLEIGSERAVDPLIETFTIALDDQPKTLWSIWLSAVRPDRIGWEHAVDPLIERLPVEPDVDARCAIVHALGRIGSERAVDPLLERLLVEPDVDARCAIAHALGRIGSERAVDPLIARLAVESDAYVRSGIAEALGEIGSERAVDLLIERFAVVPDAYGRSGIAEALGAIGSERAVDPLIERLAAEPSEYARKAIAEVLGRIGSERAVDPLIARLAVEPYAGARGNIAEALGRIGSERAVDPLIARLAVEPDAWTAKAIAEVLGRIGSERAVDPLIARLAVEPSEHARKAIAEALWRLSWRHKRIIPPLRSPPA